MVPPPDAMHKRKVGAGLSLDKFATLGVSKFDKRKKLERIQKERLIKHSKFSKLKKKLEAKGVLSSVQVRDSIAELEALDSEDPEHDDKERQASHARAGPSNKRTRLAPLEAVSTKGKEPVSQKPKQPLAPAARGEGRGHSFDNGEDGPGGIQRTGQHDTHGGARGRQESIGQREPKESRWGHNKRGDPSKRAGAKPQNNESEDMDGEAGDDRQHSLQGARAGKYERDIGKEHGGKKLSRLQRLAQQVAEEKAEKQRAKEAAMKEREERMQKMAAAEKARKDQKHFYFKRNAKGQPLMRYRMEKLLAQLQHTA